jgi:hypothetical protein
VKTWSNFCCSECAGSVSVAVGSPRRRIAERFRWPIMRAERAKLKSRRDDMRIAPGKRGAARGYCPKMNNSLFSKFGFARLRRAKPNFEKRENGSRVAFTQGSDGTSALLRRISPCAITACHYPHLQWTHFSFAVLPPPEPRGGLFIAGRNRSAPLLFFGGAAVRMMRYASSQIRPGDCIGVGAPAPRRRKTKSMFRVCPTL